MGRGSEDGKTRESYMSEVKNLHKETCELYNFLYDNEIKREDKTKEINSFIDRQVALLNNLPQATENTDEDRRLLEEVINLKPKIEEKMNEIQSEIKKDIARVKNTKRLSEQKKPSPIEGTFFDAKH